MWSDKVAVDLLDAQLDTVDAPTGVGYIRRRLADAHHAVVGISGENGVAPLLPEGIDLIPWSVAKVLKDGLHGLVVLELMQLDLLLVVPGLVAAKGDLESLEDPSRAILVRGIKRKWSQPHCKVPLAPPDREGW